MGEIYKVQIIALKEYGEIYPHITVQDNVYWFWIRKDTFKNWFLMKEWTIKSIKKFWMLVLKKVSTIVKTNSYRKDPFFQHFWLFLALNNKWAPNSVSFTI